METPAAIFAPLEREEDICEENCFLMIGY
jgi:hypothetical protein